MTQPNGDPGDPANSGPSGGVTTNLFTQDQVNTFNAAAKREAVTKYFKDLGYDSVPTVEDLKGTLGKASEYDKLKDGEKGDVQRLTDQLGVKTKEAEQVPVLKNDLLRAQIAADAGLKSRYWKYIEGDSEDDIKASVQDVLRDIRVGTGDGEGEGEGEDEGDQGGADDGGKKRLTPNPQQGAASSGGGAKKPSMSAGAEAYKARYGKKE